MSKNEFVLWMVPATVGIILIGLAMGIGFAAVMIYTAFDEDVREAWKEKKNPLTVVKSLYTEWFGSN